VTRTELKTFESEWRNIGLVKKRKRGPGLRPQFNSLARGADDGLSERRATRRCMDPARTYSLPQHWKLYKSELPLVRRTAFNCIEKWKQVDIPSTRGPGGLESY
jgi:hypothetical protein